MNCLNYKISNEFKTAITIVWYVLSLVIVMILVLSFIKPMSIINEIPICEYKLQEKSCVLCGMTRAFLEITIGNFQKANRLNQGSILLFSFFILNTITIIINIKLKTITKIKL